MKAFFFSVKAAGCMDLLWLLGVVTLVASVFLGRGSLGLFVCDIGLKSTILNKTYILILLKRANCRFELFIILKTSSDSNVIYIREIKLLSFMIRPNFF